MKGAKLKMCVESNHNIYDGERQRVCRTCDNARCYGRYKNNHEYRAKHRIWVKERYLKAVEIVNRGKMRPCFDCNVQYSPWIMQYDHRDGKQKSFTIGRTGRMKTLEVLQEEINKCDVVCGNCHAERTHKMLPEFVERRLKQISSR